MTPKTIIFCTLLVLFSFSQIQATIIHVPADYSTIQAGINGAVGGDTVLVARGHYYERIDFRGKGILVTSNLIFDNDSNTIDSTIIDANGTGSVVWFDSGEDSTSVIQGFTITGGDGTWGEGGGIWCRWCSPTIRNNTIAANSAGRGGGIWCHDSSPNIHNNTLMGNFADFQGGGIYYQGDSPPRIENNAIIGNSAGSRGGGIAVYTYMSTISGNTISGNSAGNLGGGIYVAAYSSSPHICNNALSGNSASSCGGAIFCDQSSQPNIQNNSITGNEADSAGGGICCRVSFPTIRNNMIVNNGQGIVCGPESAPVVYHNDVWGNVDGDFCACAPGVGDTSWGVNVNGTPCDSFYNIMRDPVFVDPDSDSHLQDGSPCIDAGDNHAPGLRETDFDGNPRIIDGNEDGTAVVDLGMLEYLPRDLIAYFSASDTSGLVPLAVTFIDRSIGYPTSWFWNFGDGDTSTMQNPTHSYIDTGHYDVKLVVSDGTNTDSLVRYNYIHVLPEVVADFAAEPVLGPIPLKVHFTDLTIGDPVTWLWDFGDDSTSTNQHPTHTYADTGHFDVKLVVTDAQSTDSLIREDYIHVTLCCPEDPNDRGACDTLSVVCLDCETDSPPPGIRSVRYILLVTHDQVNEIDSLAGFVVPLSWTHTNPSAYCSLGAYWNTTSTLWDAPNFERSIFRHVVEDADTLYHNRMADLAADYSGRDWDTRILDLSSNDDSSYMRMALFSTGTADQRWWEGERVLLATLTFRMQDTMHVCIDSSFWPPASHLNFIRDDGVPYVPRDNLPCCFRIDMLTVDGDANGDGVVDPGDVVYSINYLFRDGAPPVPLESGDANCDGHMGPGDIVYLLNYLFRNGPAPCG